MTLRLRFLFSLLAVIAIMAVPAIYGVSRVFEVRDIALDLREQSATSVIAVGRLRTALEQFDRFQRLHIATPDAEYSEEMWRRLREAQSELDLLRRSRYGQVVDSADIPLAELAEVTTRLDALVAGDLLETATTYRELAAAPLLRRSEASIPTLAEAIDAHTARRAAVAERSADAAATAATTSALIALVLAGALAVAAAGVLSSPLSRLVTAMARVADGQFDTPRDLAYGRQDELGDLSRSFRAMTGRLAQLDQMKAEFVSAATHGLKTPIGVIGGYAELIREEDNDGLSERQRELIAALADQTDVLRRRLDQLLEISRMEAGALTLGLEEIYLRHFVADLESAYAPRAIERGLDFTVRLDEHTPPFLIADPDVLRIDVFDNLVGNALKFTPRGGSIEIAIRPDAELIVFDVADSGPGIPPDQIDRVFEKYWQGRDAGGGSGLGLAIAQAAVLAHNGRIDARNLPGRGVRFRVVLPATPSSQLQTAPERTPRLAPRTIP